MEILNIDLENEISNLKAFKVGYNFPILILKSWRESIPNFLLDQNIISCPSIGKV